MRDGLPSGKYNNRLGVKKLFTCLLLFLVVFFTGCGEEKEHIAPAVNERDSLPTITTFGINQLISDSGVIKYRIVTEEWRIYENTTPKKFVFPKGVFLEQFDEKFHVQSYIQTDSAFYNMDKELWKLKGHVRILTKAGLRFSSEELFWDQRNHELYSYRFSRLVTPDRTLQGTYFRSDERMTKYEISNTKGSFNKSDFTGEPDTTSAQEGVDSPMIRPQTEPRPRSN